jgi:hypothetical protein
MLSFCACISRVRACLFMRSVTCIWLSDLLLYVCCACCMDFKNRSRLNVVFDSVVKQLCDMYMVIRMYMVVYMVIIIYMVIGISRTEVV